MVPAPSQLGFIVLPESSLAMQTVWQVRQASFSLSFFLHIRTTHSPSLVFVVALPHPEERLVHRVLREALQGGPAAPPLLPLTPQGLQVALEGKNETNSQCVQSPPTVVFWAGYSPVSPPPSRGGGDTKYPKWGGG